MFIYFFYVYKFDFNTIIEHYCYLKIKQKTTSDSSIYIQLKKVVTKIKSFFNLKSTLFKINFNYTMFNYFVDDDVDETNTLKNLMKFLHDYYFSRFL